MSRPISQFLPWIDEWVGGYASKIQNTERRAEFRGGDQFWIC